MAGEAMSLLDYASSQKDNFLVQGFVNALLEDGTPGGGMGLLKIMPIVNSDSLTMVIPRLVTEGVQIPGTRPIGGAYNQGVVTIQTETNSVGNYGQDVFIDKAFLAKTANYIAGAAPEVLQTKYLAARMNRAVNNALMNGLKASDPNSFNGIRYFTDTQQVISVASDIPNSGSYTNGLSVWSSPTTAKNADFLSAIDYLLDAVGAGSTWDTPRGGKVYLIMNNQAKRSLFNAVRGVGGSAGTFFATTKDSYNQDIDTYRGVQIINPGAKNPVKTLKDAISNTNAILPNNFSFGSANNATEIYAVRVGQGDGCVMTQYQPLDVRTVMDEVSQNPSKLIRADWYPGFYRFKEAAIAKLTGCIVV